MNKLLPLLVLVPLLATACAAEPEPQPKPDPAHVERLLASLQPPPPAAADLPAPAEEKLAKVDRLVGTLEKVEPKRIDPGLAENLLAR